MHLRFVASKPASDYFRATRTYLRKTHGNPIFFSSRCPRRTGWKDWNVVRYARDGDFGDLPRLKQQIDRLLEQGRWQQEPDPGRSR